MNVSACFYSEECVLYAYNACVHDCKVQWLFILSCRQCFISEFLSWYVLQVTHIIYETHFNRSMVLSPVSCVCVSDPTHTTCGDPGTPLFGNLNNSQGYQVWKCGHTRQVIYLYWKKTWNSFSYLYSSLCVCLLYYAVILCLWFSSVDCKVKGNHSVFSDTVILRLVVIFCTEF